MAGRILKPQTLFRRNALDFCHIERANEQFMMSMTRHPKAQMLVFQGAGKVLWDGSMVLARDQVQFHAHKESLVFLGTAEGDNDIIPYFSFSSTDAKASDYTSTGDFMSTKKLWLELTPKSSSILSQATMLHHWNEKTTFCSQCGSGMEPELGGVRRRCESCDVIEYPRVDPSVIMFVINKANTHALVCRGYHHKEGIYSCMAGFMDPWETIEDAVRREVWEESGIAVGRVSYSMSQPWPFPRSLMIGCFAEADTEKVVVNTGEVADVKWVSRGEAKDALANACHPPDTYSDGIFCWPSVSTIAYNLAHQWVLNERAPFDG